jgi:hypothetical protein
MADGSVKSIEEIKAGDIVLSLNLTTNKLESKQVVKTFVREAEYLHSVTIGSETLYTTAGHPFLTEKGYVDAEELGVGTSLVTRAGPDTSSLSSLVGVSPTWGGASITGNLRYNPEQVFFGQRGDAGYTVYNFEVEDNHNYFVGKTNGGICVHNADPSKYKTQFKGYIRELLTDEATELNPHKIARWIDTRSYRADAVSVVFGKQGDQTVAIVSKTTGRLDKSMKNRARYLFKRLDMPVYMDDMKRGMIGNSGIKEHAEDIAERIAVQRGVDLKKSTVGASLRVCPQCTAGVCAKHGMTIFRR